MKGRKTTFTPGEDQYLIDNYLTVPVKAMARAINRSGYGTRCRMRDLGLIVPKDIAEQRKKMYHFKAGHTPDNKGKKMKDEVREKIKHTWFKKGSVPHNVIQDWGEVIRRSHGKPYILIKIPGERKLKYKHIWVWEQHHNKKLPKGYNVIFSNGNTLDVQIDNLECLSNRELLDRNAIRDYPLELQRVIKIKNKIQKHLKNGGIGKQ